MRNPILAMGVFVFAGCGSTGGGGTRVSTTVVESQGGMVPAGTIMTIELDDSIRGKDARVGDLMTAEITQQIASSQGEMLVPSGARVYGRIGAVRDAQGDQPAAIQIVLDSVEIGGLRQPLQATIVKTEVITKGGVEAKHVGIGAAVGAILGGLTHGAGGALVGGALGAGGGALISLGMNREKAELPAGTQMAIRLDQPIRSYAALQRRLY